MQDPDVGIDERAGAEEGEDGYQSPQAPEAQASSQSSATEGDRGSFPQSGPQDSSSPAAPGSQAVPGSPSPGSPVGSGAAAEEAAVVPPSEQPPLVPGPSGDTASTTGIRLLEYSVTVPFRSAVEANMARRSLVSNSRLQQVMVQYELTVNGNILSVWTTEDLVLFRISINTFLDQLSLVMRNIQRLEFVAVVKRGQRRSRES